MINLCSLFRRFKWQTYISSIPFIDCKIREINKIKQLNCVKIEYSKIFPSIGKCIDSRLLIK